MVRAVDSCLRRNDGGGGRNDGMVGAGTMEWDACGNERGMLRWISGKGGPWVPACAGITRLVSVRMVGVEVSGSRPAPG